MAKIWLDMVVKQPFMSRKFDAPPSSYYLFNHNLVFTEFPINFHLRELLTVIKELYKTELFTVQHCIKSLELISYSYVFTLSTESCLLISWLTNFHNLIKFSLKEHSDFYTTSISRDI